MHAGAFIARSNSEQKSKSGAHEKVPDNADKSESRRFRQIICRFVNGPVEYSEVGKAKTQVLQFNRRRNNKDVCNVLDCFTAYRNCQRRGIAADQWRFRGGPYVRRSILAEGFHFTPDAYHIPGWETY